MNKEEIKKNLKEAREKGWWMACFYWEKKLKFLIEEDIKEVNEA